jgi:TRAP-type C4-dicarboxylate transport system substrate-binding protein
MFRRHALGLVALTALGIFGIAPPASAQTIELKLSHYLPPNHTVHKFLEAWATELADRSKGRLTVKIFPASQLGPVQRQFDLARSGQADLAVGLVGATPGRYPVTELANLPFVWPKEGSTSAVMSERLTQLAPKYLANEFTGLQILWFGVTPTNSVFTSRRKIAGRHLQGRHRRRGIQLRSRRELRSRPDCPLHVAEFFHRDLGPDDERGTLPILARGPP